MKSKDLQTAHDIAAAMKTPRRRTMREFAESEIIIPTGVYESLRFSCTRQPYSALYFAAVENPYWNRVVAMGPSQSGKTLTCFIIPTLYHLFEIGETVICGLPSMDMATDKWNEDLLPAIERSKYKEFLPRSGSASKGGKSNLRAVTFTNGATLRFMSGGGDDKKRAGFTSRVLVVTETDGLDQAGGKSREADKLKQMEARTNAFGDRKKVYMECTVSVDSGRTWTEYKAGSTSRIVIRCPHCAKHVTPEREHLVGWQDAIDEIEAHEKGRVACPECGALWTDDDRRIANANSKLVHKGQTILEDGTVEGDLPRTNTLGFRWSAVNNLLVQTGTIAKAEWKASREGSEDNAEKEMCQFWWAKPYTPSTLDLTVMDHNAIMNRVDKAHPHGHVPEDGIVLALGVDVGKWLCHWVVTAFRPHATPHIVDYGRLEVPSRDMAEEKAILIALRGLRDDVLRKGWKSTAGQRFVQVGFIDARYKPEAVFQFCDETRGVLFPSMGYGSTQRDSAKFIRKARDACLAIGEEYQVVRRTDGKGVVVEINSDHWKGWLHSRAQTPMGQPGAMTLYRPEADSDKYHHLSFSKHLTAEKKVEEYTAGRGLVTKWVMVSRHNHYLDASSYSCAAGHAAGVRPLGNETIVLPSAPPTPSEKPSPTTPRRDEDHSWMPERPSNWMP
jgi:phage terminase large subunit GpA-like protein